MIMNMRMSWDKKITLAGIINDMIFFNILDNYKRIVKFDKNSVIVNSDSFV